MISVTNFLKMVEESPSVEQAFGKYMSLLDSEFWDFSALPTIFNEREPMCPELIEVRIEYGKDEALVWCKGGETGEKD